MSARSRLCRVWALRLSGVSGSFPSIRRCANVDAYIHVSQCLGGLRVMRAAMHTCCMPDFAAPVERLIDELKHLAPRRTEKRQRWRLSVHCRGKMLQLIDESFDGSGKIGMQHV